MYLSIVMCTVMVAMVTNVDAAESKNEAVKNYTLTEDVGSISSPNWNTNSYPDNSNIWWKIVTDKENTIQLKFSALNVKNPFGECTKDFIEVYTDPKHGYLHGTYCSDHLPPKGGVIKSVSNELFVHFVSDGFFKDGHDTDRGFLAEYTVLDKDGQSVATLAPPTDDDYDYEDYEYEEGTTKSTTTTQSTASISTTQSTSTTTQTTTSTTSTQAPKTTSAQAPKTTSTSAGPTTVLITKISTHANEGTSPTATIPMVIVAAIVAAVVVACFVIFLCWKKKNSTHFISLRQNSDDQVFVTDDRKQLVSDSEPTIYKKHNGSQFSSVPQQESFPL